MMKTHRKDLCSRTMGRRRKNNRIEVTEDNVADVVSDDGIQ
jgi:hypothetical protein